MALLDQRGGRTVSPQLTPLLDRLCSPRYCGGSGVAFLLTKHLQAPSQPTSAEGSGEGARAMAKPAPRYLGPVHAQVKLGKPE